MTTVGKILRRISGKDGYRAIAHWCPGCETVHAIRVDQPRGWQFNGDYDRPTVSPSVRISDNAGTICHYFIRDGKIEFCSDSPHALAGKTVDIPDWPYAPGTYGGIDE